MAYDAGNKKDIRRAEKAAALVERERIDYLRAAMASRPGRAWFYDLLERCHLFSDPFLGDALREAYSKGERNVGLSIYADIVSQAPDDFVLMMREANERRSGIHPDSDDAPSGEYSGRPDSGRDTEGPITSEFDPFEQP